MSSEKQNPESLAPRGLSNKPWFLILAAGIVLGVVVGYTAGGYLGGNSFQQGLKQGRREVEEEYEEKMEQIFPSNAETEEIYSIYGEITSINGTTLTVKQEIHPANPLKDSETKMWRVEVTEETELVMMVERSLEELETTDDELLEPFTEVEIEFSELEQGDMVQVRAEENIKGKEAFPAQRVILEVMPEPMPEEMPEEISEGEPEDL